MKLFGISQNALVGALVGAGVMGAVIWGPQFQDANARQISIEAPGGAPISFANLVESVSPAVVSINVEVERKVSAAERADAIPEPFRRMFPNAPDGEDEVQRGFGAGSGFFISSDGFVVTNHHVVEDAVKISLTLEDGRELDAKMIGSDESTDLAVLKVTEKGSFPFISFGDSSDLRRGDWVVAVGNPLGLGGTVTAGIISAIGKPGEVGRSSVYTDFLQIDAAINRGNSGGPAFNLSGDVIGVNSRLLSPDGSFIGYGLAIPSNVAKSITKTLMEDGEVERGWLGVRISSLSEEMAEAQGLKSAKGAIVASLVNGSPAAKAGIKRGDVIIEVNGIKMDDSTQTTRFVGGLLAGSTNDFVVLRDGKRTKLKVKVGARPKNPDAPFEPESDDSAAEAPLGVTLRPLDEETRERFNIDVQDSGLIIDEIDSESPFAEVGVRPGMVILDINNKPVRSVSDFEESISEARAKGRSNILVFMHNGRQTLFVPIAISED